MIVRAAVSALLAAVVLTACGDDDGVVRPEAPTFAPADSSLNGTVTAGPACPVEQAGTPCPDRPVGGAVVELVGADDKVVLNTVTDATGRFQLRAPAGSYILRATNTGGLPSQASEPVTLTAGRASTVKLTVDSGIR
ncbi:MAG: carboxypeptidase-like regulatory domain-containing protein [Sporichthyaceae bacterium]